MNYGFITGNSNVFPVYACSEVPTTDITASLSLTTSSMTVSKNGTVQLYGRTAVSLDETTSSVTVGNEQCTRLEVCSQICQTCSRTIHCPVGFSCIYSAPSTGNCFLNCGSIYDNSCPCNTVCQPLYQPNGVLNFCAATSITSGGLCSGVSPFNLQCSLPKRNTTAASVSLAIESGGNVSVAMFAPSVPIDTSCQSAAECIDQDLCTVDSCVNGLCHYDLLPGCSTISPAYKTSHRPIKQLIVSLPNSASSQSAWQSWLRATGNQSAAQYYDNSPQEILSSIGFQFSYFGNAVSTLAINPNGVLAFPPFFPCSSLIGAPRCLTYSTMANALSLWASDWDPSQSTASKIYYHLGQAGNSAKNFSILYSQFRKQGSSAGSSSFGASINDDGSILLRYISIASSCDYMDTFGTWSSKASEKTDAYLNLNNYNLSFSSIGNATDIALCTFNALVCAPNACVSTGDSLYLAWKGINCNALPGVLAYNCNWAGGAATTAGSLVYDVQGRVSGLNCPVPALSFPNASLIPLDVSIVPSVGALSMVNAEKALLYAMTLANAELSSHNILVRYFLSGASSCGCSAIPSLGQLSCDTCNVCGGNGKSGVTDCNGDCFGSAYTLRNGTCVAGLTGSYPILIDDFPRVIPEDTSIYNLISLIILVAFFFMIFLVLCLCLRIIILGAPTRNDHEMVFLAYNFADTIGIRRLILTERHMREIGEFTYSAAHIEEQGQGAGETSNECSICLSDFVEGEVCRCLPAPCNHTFHKKCIDEWFEHQNSSCPLCKRSIYRILMNMPEPLAGEDPNTAPEIINRRALYHDDDNFRIDRIRVEHRPPTGGDRIGW